MTDIYLDIDGVLLANDVYKAKHSDKFIEYVAQTILILLTGLLPIVDKKRIILFRSQCSQNVSFRHTTTYIC